MVRDNENSETSADRLQKLKHIRSGYKGRVTYFANKIKGSNFNSVGELESALTRLRLTYSKFDETQTELELVSDQEFEYRDEFEDEFGFVEGAILDRIEKLRMKLNQNNIKIPKEDQLQTSAPLKLPNIQLPKFDGFELNWLDFRGIFTELIHSNNNLSNIAKFHYLQSCIREGKAYKFIQPFSISDENYPIAWKNLADHYNDEIYIKKLHIKKIYEIKKPLENSASSLQYFIDVVIKSHNALKALKVPVETWDLFLIYHLSERLDEKSKVAVIKGSPLSEILSFDKFILILRERHRILEAQKPSNTSHQSERTQKESSMKPIYVKTAQNIKCGFCGFSHTLNQCPKFKDNNLSPQNRYEIVKKFNLCTNCLQENHRIIDCKSSPCSQCGLKHNTLLHFGRNNTTSSESTNQNHKDSSNPSQSSMISNTSTIKNCSSSKVHNFKQFETNQILLATAVVWVRCSSGDRFQCRVLLDSGSQANFISKVMCGKLSLKTEPTHVSIKGINGDTSTITKKVNVVIESRVSNFKTNLTCLVKPKISDALPSCHIYFNKTMIHENIQLADPWFYKPDNVDLLIGAEIFSEIMSGGKMIIIQDLPFYNTVFGHVVMGKAKSNQNLLNDNAKSVKTSVMSLSVFENLNEQIKRFWEIENIENPKTQSIEEKLCELHYASNVSRLSTGRYSVALPTKSNIFELGNSSTNASNQFFTMEKRLNKKSELYEQYSQFMEEYIELKHMTEVSNPEETNCEFKNNYYMPHHAVIREKSSTTKLRVVFNASSKTSNNISLNDCLMVGPTIQQDLYSIIMRFRKHKIGIVGDITKMYRQILVHDKHQDLQRIWWRESESAPLKCYKLRTVTYGTASAPFLAIRTLFQLAKDEQTNFPEASEVLKQDFYVDDVLTGSDNIENAIKLKKDLVNLLSKGGFELRKIISNHLDITSSEYNTQSKSIPVLGMNWNIETDKFNFSFTKYLITNQCTKRSVLSEIAQLFDPLGLCAPVVFLAKAFMQALWASKLDEISVPRCVIASTPKLIELHGFGDASEKGYGCVIYIRTIDYANNVYINFLCSKSRVAPLKVQTIPRLELCASLLLAEAVEKIIFVMKIEFNSIFLWTDSEITLCRIKSSPGRFEIFVANRISKIQDLSSPKDWHYIPTTDNPADMVSRGLMPEEFSKCKQWWTGPSFLNKLNLIIPRQPSLSINELEISKVSLVGLKESEEWISIVKHSNFHKILRIFAYINRFIKSCRQKNRTSYTLPREISMVKPLDVEEINSALKSIIKHIQQVHFSMEINNLNKNKYVSRESKLLALTPFLDNEGIIRVGGRLKNSNIPFDHKHQSVVPSTHSFIKLLVKQEHVRLLHAGPQTVLYNLRQRLWIIGGRNLCRKVISECITCIRARPKILGQIMGQLPNKRVQPSRPFENVGVDFCGPFLTTSKVRSRVQEKVYISIFICFVTKAVHMEVVSDLSTSAFLAALRRFVSRRGLCSNIYSDNATNFVGSKGELQDLRRLFLSECHQNEIFKFCMDSNIQWHTIPARSPHFGGLWEAAVKSAKFHIKRVVGSSSFTIEQLHTIIVQVEGCLNSRPIGPMSNDPNDFESLTPGHFLIGQPIVSVPDPSLLHLKFNKLQHFQKVQYTLQTFWKRWMGEYLSLLQQRRKWMVPCKSPQVGDLVILKEDNVPPLKWPMARIISLHKGEDGFVRVVTVRTSTSEFKRTITKICPLPIKNELAENGE